MGNGYADHVTPLYPLKLALTSPTGGGRSVGIVRSRAEATEFYSVAVRIIKGLRTVRPVLFLTIKPTRCTNFSNLFLELNSTLFGQFLCPSSGVFHCICNNDICHTILLTACEQEQMPVAGNIVRVFYHKL